MIEMKSLIKARWSILLLGFGLREETEMDGIKRARRYSGYLRRLYICFWQRRFRQMRT